MATRVSEKKLINMDTIKPAAVQEFKKVLPKLSVVMPAFNEARVIFKSILATAGTLEDCDFEIIVVDDGSSDETYNEALRAAQVIEDRRAKGHVIVLRNEPNQGKGHALKFGCAHATGDLVAFLDADLDLNPWQLWSLWEIMYRTGADVVIGSKNHPESKLIYPWHRKFLSKSYFALVNLLFGLPLHDTQTGIKIFRHEVLDRVLPRMQVQRFAYDLELLVGAFRFGYRIVEAPVVLTFQGGKMGLVALVHASLDIWIDTLRVFYWASSWKWLSPSAGVRLWIVGLMLGISALSFGVSGFLSRANLPQFMKAFGDIVFLRFLSHPVRDGLLVLVGLLVTAFAAIQVNKAILAAFSRPDDGSLAGIPNNTVKNGDSSQPEMKRISDS